MTIDATDYEPRPADDYLSEFPPKKPHPLKEEFPRAYSIIIGRGKRDPFCHQFGCNFSDLPHG